MLRNKEVSLLFVPILLIPLHLSGCAIGYITFHTEHWETTEPPSQLDGVIISYNTDNESVSSSLERMLRGRFHVLDIQQTTEAGLQNNAPEQFIISVRTATGKLSTAEIAWAALSLLSCATIPVTVGEDFPITYTVIAPGGDQRTFQYRYTERSYSWLPLLLFGPELFAVFPGGGPTDTYDDERVNMLDKITIRFLTEATPFILAHRTSPST